MSKFPVIDSPCPLRANAMPQTGKDHCGHCDRQVHNLDGMSRSQREAFMRSCAGQKVCVAYTVQRKAERRNLGLGITMLATLTGSGLAAAQDAPKESPAQHASETKPAAKLFEVQTVVSDTVITAEDVAAIPLGPGITAPHRASVESTTILTAEQIQFVALGGVLDAGQARWADEDEIEASALDTLPNIGELEWLPSKQP
ncbi:hypothetical protein [Arenimonas sp.]|uniref:hypothetical protein n=1 Tax=Arenimonas sp. TaxID=1872635 RepID=UPI0039E2956B